MQISLDDTANIQNALNLAQNTSYLDVNLNPGAYSFTAPLTIYSNTRLRGGGYDVTQLTVSGTTSDNLIQSAAFGNYISPDTSITIEDLTLAGPLSSSYIPAVTETYTSLGAFFQGGTWATLPVASVTGFPLAGYFWLGANLIQYTGVQTTPTVEFTGCTVPGGGAMPIAYQHQRVLPFNSAGHGIALQCQRARVRDVRITTTIGSSVFIQGGSSNAFGCILEDLRLESPNRWGFELRAQATDGFLRGASVTNMGGQQIQPTSPGSYGGALIMSSDWVIDDFHPVGSEASSNETNRAPGIVISTSNTKVRNLMLDTIWGPAIIIDCWDINTPAPLNDTIIDGVHLIGPALGPGSGALVLCRTGVTSNVISRLQLSNATGEDYPYSWLIAHGAQTQTVGSTAVGATQMQVVEAASFDPYGSWSTSGGQLSAPSQTLTYAGVTQATTATTMTQTITKAAGGSLDVTSTTGFPASGTVLVNGSFPAPYTSTTSTTFVIAAGALPSDLSVVPSEAVSITLTGINQYITNTTTAQTISHTAGGSLDVASTAAFLASGTVLVNGVQVPYTSTTSTTFVIGAAVLSQDLVVVPDEEVSMTLITGIPASGPGSVMTSAIPSGTVVTQPWTQRSQVQPASLVACNVQDLAFGTASMVSGDWYSGGMLPTPPTFPASGTPFVNPYGLPASLYISGGSVSAIAVNGTTTGRTSGVINLPAQDSITVTYTSAPSWVWIAS